MFTEFHCVEHADLTAPSLKLLP